MKTDTEKFLKILGIALGLAFALVCAGLGLILNTASGNALNQAVESALGGPDANVPWFITRSSGLVAYLLLWLSTLWGLVLSSKAFDPLLERLFNFDLHEYVSLLAIAFLAVHMGALLWDAYEPFTVSELAIPFVSEYRPIWTGLGIIGFYLILLVTITFYLRRRLSYRVFRSLHFLSYAAFALALLHGIYAGTDSPLWTTRLMYLGTGLSVVFFTSYHFILVLGNRGGRQRQSTRAPSVARSR